MLERKMGASFKIFREFRSGVFYEELYEKYNITREGLIRILNNNIKGSYDYNRVLSSHAAQKQFISHLKSRWNPLEPDAPHKDISPYLSGSGVKTRFEDGEDT